MDLMEFVSSRHEPVQYNLALELIESALPVWEAFASEGKKLEYVDTVVGMYYVGHTMQFEMLVLHKGDLTFILADSLN